MRIGVLRYQQDIATEPEHFISKELARRFLEYRHNGKLVAERVHDRVIKIIINITFGELKDSFR